MLIDSRNRFPKAVLTVCNHVYQIQFTINPTTIDNVYIDEDETQENLIFDYNVG